MALSLGCFTYEISYLLLQIGFPCSVTIVATDLRTASFRVWWPRNLRPFKISCYSCFKSQLAVLKRYKFVNTDQLSTLTVCISVTGITFTVACYYHRCVLSLVISMLASLVRSSVQLQTGTVDTMWWFILMTRIHDLQVYLLITVLMFIKLKRN